MVDIDSAVTFVYGITCTLSYFANTFILFVLVKAGKKVMQFSLRCMLVLMTVSDLLQTLFFIFPMAVTRLKPSLTSPWLCNLISFSRVSLCSMSMMTITFIGLERFRGLRQMRADPCGRWQVIGILVGIVAAGGGLGAGRLLKDPKFGEMTFGECNWEDVYLKSRGRSSIYRCGLVWGLNCLLWLSYLGVTVRLIQSYRDLSQSGLSNTALIQHRRRTLRVTFNCVLLALTFTTCWTPMITVSLLYQITDIDLDHIHNITLIPALLTCLLNPAINGLMMRSVLSRLKRVPSSRRRGISQEQQRNANSKLQNKPTVHVVDSGFRNSSLSTGSNCINPSADFKASSQISPE